MPTSHSAFLQKPLTLAVRFALATLAAVPLAAFAQDSTTSPTTDTTKSPAANQQVQRVEVTGSRIRRTDLETPSPVQVISAKEIRETGYTSVSEVLRNITANGQGILSQSFSGAFAAGASGISLRGLTVGVNWVSSFDVIASVLNLFNKPPPLDFQTYGSSPSTFYNPALGLNYKF